MQAYSMDLRERALLDSDAGMKAADVAVKYRVSGSWVRLLKQRRRETGEVAPRVQRTRAAPDDIEVLEIETGASKRSRKREKEQSEANRLRPHACYQRLRGARNKVAGVRQAIERVGATLCYRLRPVRAARCRSTETLWPFLGACLPHFSPEECRNYFRHCGYPGTTRS